MGRRRFFILVLVLMSLALVLISDQTYLGNTKGFLFFVSAVSYLTSFVLALEAGASSNKYIAIFSVLWALIAVINFRFAILQ